MEIRSSAVSIRQSERRISRASSPWGAEESRNEVEIVSEELSQATNDGRGVKP